MDTTEITWDDRQYPVPDTLPAPPSFTGAQQVTRQFADTVATWGHTIVNVTYLEETATDANGRPTRHTGPRATRAEFTADGHAVVIRHDLQSSWSESPWTVTVDGQPQEYPPLYRLTWPERVRMLALTVHRAER
ncbi:hypothetical protein [Actinacidiphila soli]|uniref:hypothetical protein n=1 Tax=Actinacidiphila soli TaxID=2487275 RepID=UPI000FCB367D|nr:hypothetical protein [Actinacidiphila soli]